VLSGGKNQPFVMPVSIANFGWFGIAKILQKISCTEGKV
jgi:hypothetical protein